MPIYVTQSRTGAALSKIVKKLLDFSANSCIIRLVAGGWSFRHARTGFRNFITNTQYQILKNIIGRAMDLVSPYAINQVLVI